MPLHANRILRFVLLLFDTGALDVVWPMAWEQTKDIVETTLALDNFKRACDCGRGAVFFSIARGKVAEGIDFDRHYGRCVVMIGVPFQYTLSHILRARLEWLRHKHNIKEVRTSLPRTCSVSKL